MILLLNKRYIKNGDFCEKKGIAAEMNAFSDVFWAFHINISCDDADVRL